MRISRFISRFLAGAVVPLGFATSSPLQAQDALKWTFNEGPDARGRTVARLVYGVPETDNQMFAGVCEARSSTGIAFSALTMAVDVGRLKNGAGVKVRFSGGGREHVLPGEVTGVGNTNEGIAGILVRPKHSDQFWSMMTELPAVDYKIPGYRSTVLNLKNGHSKIRSFVSACQAYQRALQPAAQTANSGISEKEAFDLAKELGTREGWDAFLAQFPNGSRAGFAKAYIKRLSGGSSTATTASPPAATTPSAPEPAVLPKPTLSTVARGPATSRWVNRTERMAIAGGKSVYTASVRVPGVELVTYCVDNSDGIGLGAVVRRKGSYPSFSRRVRQGLAANPKIAGTANREIKIEFSNGETVDGGGARSALVGGSLGIGPNAGIFIEGSSELEYLMSENTVSVELEPFAATFQLNGSRKAICSVMNRCGAQVPRCGASGSARPAAPVPVTTTQRCSGGRYYSRSQGRCTCPSSRPTWNGRSCARLQCGRNFKLLRGRCVQLQNCGRNAYRNPEGDCFCNRGFRRTGSGRCVRVRRNCPGGQYWENGRCVSERVNCGRGRTWVGAQGRCVCVQPNRVWNGSRCVIKRRSCTGGRQLDRKTGQCFCPGDSSWDGRRCFKASGPSPRPRPPQNNNNVKKNVCTVLQAACQFGSKAACKNFKKNGC